MRVLYDITINFQIAEELNALDEVLSGRELADLLAQVVADEISDEKVSMCYEVIAAGFDIKQTTA